MCGVGQTADVLEVVRMRPAGRGVVLAARREGVLVSERRRAVEDGEETVDEAAVTLVRHPPTVVTLARQVHQCLEWWLGVLVGEHLQHTGRR